MQLTIKKKKKILAAISVAKNLKIFSKSLLEEFSYVLD